ncbi:hypothetical protein GCM10010466_42740 [Planomonospora alba]|uniref:histidine kinase n=1 Tax=Planomonospora alba TaxID=161354 RepID=A0ABP6NGE3_9ACTN
MLHAAGLLEAAGAPLLDRVTAMAVRLLGVRAATVSLVGSDRQVVVSAAGAGAQEGRSALPQSLCRQIVAAGTPLVVTDARADERWRGVEAVHDGQPAACAGMPLRAPTGQALGALCVTDAEPRRWSAEQLTTLEDLTAMAETEIALRLERASAADLRHVLDGIPEPCLCLDADGTTTVWNAAAERLFGRPAEQALGRPVEELISSRRSRRDCAHRLRRVRHGDAPAGQRVELTCADGSGREFPAELIVQACDAGHRSAWPAVLHDVSERRRTESELERERTFLAALFDSLDVAVGACDSQGRLVFNQVLRESIRASERPVEMTDWAEVYQLYTPDGTALLRTEEVPLVRALAGERFDGQQIVIRVPGTGPRRFQFNGRPITTADGRRLGAVAVGQDVTDRHRIEQLRTAQHAVAQALAEAPSSDQAACGVVAAVAGALDWACGEYWQVDPGGETISRTGLWTRPGRDLSALTRDEPDVFPPGRGLAGTVWATDRELWVPDLAADPRDFARKRTALRCGLRAAMGLPVRSGHQILGVLTFFSDTLQEADPDLVELLDGVCAHVGRYMERRRAEELELALAASRRRFDQVIAQIDDYIWTNEITADGRMRSVYRSPNVAAVIGDELPPDADMAAVTARHVHPDDQETLAGFIAELNSGRPAQAEYRLIGVDGVTRWVWSRATPRREEGRLLVDGISTEVTERRELAEERERLLAAEQEQVRRLRELDRLKDELMAMVSHELRNPVGVIRGYAEMLREAPGLDDEHRAFIEVIDRKSDHLQRLVDDLLDLARLETGRVALDARTVWLPRLIQQAVDDHRAAAAAKDITLTTELAHYLHAHADPVRLRQVLDNLLSNAVKYTPPGGTVTVTAGSPGDGGDHPGRHVTVTVADTGIGIPAEEYEQLFSRFFRASTAKEAGVKGTGLGLAITKAIVEAHGGAITAAPRGGGGTVFTVCLPVAPPDSL